MPRYTVSLKDRPDVHITADDVDGEVCGDTGQSYLNFWNNKGDDSFTVAAIPFDLVVSVVS